tara:strand:- start:892 stop:1059 length:168 start_codon:yes stop_codon:yes gene_type:complete
MLMLVEAGLDCGDGYFIDNFQVHQGEDLNDPYEPYKVIFEGSKEDCLAEIEMRLE